MPERSPDPTLDRKPDDAGRDSKYRALGRHPTCSLIAGRSGKLTRFFGGILRAFLCLPGMAEAPLYGCGQDFDVSGTKQDKPHAVSAASDVSARVRGDRGWPGCGLARRPPAGPGSPALPHTPPAVDAGEALGEGPAVSVEVFVYLTAIAGGSAPLGPRGWQEVRQSAVEAGVARVLHLRIVSGEGPGAAARDILFHASPPRLEDPHRPHPEGQVLCCLAAHVGCAVAWGNDLHREVWRLLGERKPGLRWCRSG